MPRALVFLSFDMHRLAAKGIPPGDTNWVAQFPMIFFVFSWCERLGRGSCNANVIGMIDCYQKICN